MIVPSGRTALLVKQFFHDLPAGDEMLLDNALRVLRRHLTVERALRIDNQNGAQGAQAEAARLDDQDVLLQLLLPGGLLLRPR